MFIAVNTKWPATANSSLNWNNFLNGISQNITKRVEAGFSQI